MVRSAPRGAWAVVSLIWMRTIALILAVAAIARAIDAAIPSGEHHADSAAATVPLLLAALAVIAAAALNAIAESLPGRIQAREEAHWRTKVIAAAIRIFRGPAASPEQRPLTEGGVVDAATAAVEKTAGYRATFLAPTFASFSAPLLVVIGWAIIVNPLSALALAVFVALVPGCITIAGKLLRQSNAEYRRKEAAATERYLEMIDGMGTLVRLEAADRERDRFAQSARASMHELGRLLIQNQRMIIVNDAVFAVLLGAFAIGLCCGQLAAGQISLGAALAGILLTVLLQEPIDRTGRTFYVGLAGRARRDQLDRLINRARSIHEPAQEQQPDENATFQGAPRISCHDVEIEAGGNPILKHINCVLPAGKRTVIVGPSGSGKSTLLRCLAGLTSAQGRIRYDGVRVDSHTRRAHTTRMGQDAAIVSGSVRDNLKLARPDASDAELQTALQRARFTMAGQDADSAQILDASVGAQGNVLSGGAKRRLMFARVLLRDRPVLLLDEATADLDRETEAQLRAALREYSHGKTVVEIAHRIDTTLDADRILVIENGQITAAGTPEQLREQPGYYRDALAAFERAAGTQANA